ncbi:MAG TPA: hypothetical protein VF821_03345 [Lentzea sp.]
MRSSRTSQVPRSLLHGSAKKIRRLHTDYEAVERDYYRRTGIFPMMHVVAIRREFAVGPDLAGAVYRAFQQAKGIVQDHYRANAAKQHMAVITPWFSELFAENRALLVEDWWPYGLRPTAGPSTRSCAITRSRACRRSGSPPRTSSSRRSRLERAVSRLRRRSPGREFRSTGNSV